MSHSVNRLSGSAAVIALMVAAPVSAQEAERELDTVVVTATAGEQSLLTAPASISVVDQEELQLRAATDLTDALAGEPGVQITGIGMTRRGISLRGMPEEYTLYLLDGRRVSATNGVIAHSDLELGWLPAAAVEQIEVVRGPMSSLYGSDALGGVVNVISRSPTDTFMGEFKLGGSVPESGEGGESVNGSVFLSVPLIEGKLGATIVGDLFERNDLPNQQDPAVSDVEGRETATGRLGFVWTPDSNQRVDLIYTRSDDERWRDTRAAGRTPVDYEYRDEGVREQIVLGHKGDWSWGRTQVDLYQSSARRENFRTNGQTPTRDQGLEDTVLSALTALDLSKSNTLTIGGEIRREELEDEVASPDGTSEAEHGALFVQDEISLTDNFELVAGLRGDHHEAYGWEASPRLYGVFRPSGNLVIKGGYGEGFKSPSLTDLSEDYAVLAAGGRFWVFGNPDLKPETTKTFEMGVDYVADKWTVHVGAFHNQLENLIQTQCVSDCGVRGAEVRYYANLDEAEINGLELSGALDLPANVGLSANYTYLDTEDKATGERIAERPEHQANGAVSWSPRDGAEIRLRVEYTGEQLDAPGVTIPDYTLLHVDAVWPITPKVRLNAGIDNLTDERLADRSDLYTFAEPGRVYRLSLAYAF
ncbi:MAG: TonB-dependent receptor [Pseudomonadota bacterium]|nr:TonB-dependent receptor [Pseudomonadota bacterium]